jgi:hypothetical protein
MYNLQTTMQEYDAWLRPGCTVGIPGRLRRAIMGSPQQFDQAVARGLVTPSQLRKFRQDLILKKCANASEFQRRLPLKMKMKMKRPLMPLGRGRKISPSVRQAVSQPASGILQALSKQQQQQVPSASGSTRPSSRQAASQPASGILQALSKQVPSASGSTRPSSGGGSGMQALSKQQQQQVPSASGSTRPSSRQALSKQQQEEELDVLLRKHIPELFLKTKLGSGKQPARQPNNKTTQHKRRSGGETDLLQLAKELGIVVDGERERADIETNAKALANFHKVARAKTVKKGNNRYDVPLTLLARLKRVKEKIKKAGQKKEEADQALISKAKKLGVPIGERNPSNIAGNVQFLQRYKISGISEGRNWEAVFKNIESKKKQLADKELDERGRQERYNTFIKKTRWLLKHTLRVIQRDPKWIIYNKIESLALTRTQDVRKKDFRVALVQARYKQPVAEANNNKKNETSVKIPKTIYRLNKVTHLKAYHRLHFEDESVDNKKIILEYDPVIFENVRGQSEDLPPFLLKQRDTHINPVTYVLLQRNKSEEEEDLEYQYWKERQLKNRIKALGIQGLKKRENMIETLRKYDTSKNFRNRTRKSLVATITQKKIDSGIKAMGLPATLSDELKSKSLEINKSLKEDLLVVYKGGIDFREANKEIWNNVFEIIVVNEVKNLELYGELVFFTPRRVPDRKKKIEIVLDQMWVAVAKNLEWMPQNDTTKRHNHQQQQQIRREFFEDVCLFAVHQFFFTPENVTNLLYFEIWKFAPVGEMMVSSDDIGKLQEYSQKTGRYVLKILMDQRYISSEEGRVKKAKFYPLYLNWFNTVANSFSSSFKQFLTPINEQLFQLLQLEIKNIPEFGYLEICKTMTIVKSMLEELLQHYYMHVLLPNFSTSNLFDEMYVKPMKKVRGTLRDGGKHKKFRDEVNVMTSLAKVPQSRLDILRMIAAADIFAPKRVLDAAQNKLRYFETVPPTESEKQKALEADNAFEIETKEVYQTIKLREYAIKAVLTNKKEWGVDEYIKNVKNLISVRLGQEDAILLARMEKNGSSFIKKIGQTTYQQRQDIIARVSTIFEYVKRGLTVSPTWQTVPAKEARRMYMRKEQQENFINKLSKQKYLMLTFPQKQEQQEQQEQQPAATKSKPSIAAQAAIAGQQAARRYKKK